MYKSYQPIINRVKIGKFDLVTDYQITLGKEGNHFSELLNARGVNEVRQMEIYTTEPLVPDPSNFVFETAIIS